MIFESIVNIILSHCEIKKYPANYILKDKNENKFCLLLKGEAYALIKSDSGHNKPKEYVLYDIKPDEFFGSLIFSGETKTTTFEAYVKSRSICEVAEIPYDKLKHLITYSPTLLLYLLNQIATRTNHNIAMLMSQSAPKTVLIKQLLESLLSHPNAVVHPDGVQIKISRREIGLRLNISPLIVSKGLNILKSQNFIMFEDGAQTFILLGAKMASLNMTLLGVKKGNNYAL